MSAYFKYLTGTISILYLFLPSCSFPEKSNLTSDKELIESLGKSLQENILDTWYPRVIDREQGGYLSGFDYQWNPTGNQDKSLVYEARHLWATSFIYGHYEKIPDYKDYQKHGFDFLKDRLWDKEYGGFYYMINRQGQPIERMIAEKRIYGQAFAIYALSEYFRVSQNQEALELAKDAFFWIDSGAYDPLNGGYFEFLHRDGTPVLGTDRADTAFYDHFMAGTKDYNSSIHVLEALTSLYSVWPDSIVRTRLKEMFFIVRDKMIDPKGFLHLYFYPDWTRIPAQALDDSANGNSWFSEHVTFGHDIETAFLLIEAAEVLDMHDINTEKIAKKLVDHTLHQGWDQVNGGIFEKGIYLGDTSMTIIDRHKSWWSQVEALNSLVMMYVTYPDDPMDYRSYMIRQWHHIDRFLIDHENGGWYNASLDTNPDAKTGDKAHNWKTSYHTSRGMINSINRLQEKVSGNSQ